MQSSRKKKKISSGGSPDTRKPLDTPPTLKELTADKARLKTLTARQVADLLREAADEADTSQWGPIVDAVGWDRFLGALALRRAEITQPEALDLLVQGALNEDGQEAYQAAVKAQGNDDGVTDDNSVTKRKVVQTSPQQTAPTAQNSPPKPSGPVPEPSTPAETGESRQEVLANQFRDLFLKIQSRGADMTPADVYAERLQGAIAAALRTQKMKNFDATTRTTLAELMAGRLPAEVASDADVRALAKTARRFLTGLRNPQEFDSTGRPSIADRRQWVKSMGAALAADGFNDAGELKYLFQNINNMLNTLEQHPNDGASWAKLNGYIFQLNQTAKALREYRLMGVEVPISAGGADTYQETRFVDTHELVFPTKDGESVGRLREYKAYADKDSAEPDFEAKFTAQLQDYVAMAAQDPDLPDLNYVFSGSAPAWARKKLAAASVTLAEHDRKLFITERGSTSVITGATVLSMLQTAPKKQTPTPTISTASPFGDTLQLSRKNTAPSNLKPFSATPVSMVIDSSSNDSGPTKPATTTPAKKLTTTTTKKPKRKLSDPKASTKKTSTKKQKKNAVPTNNRTMDQYVIKTPTSTNTSSRPDTD